MDHSERGKLVRTEPEDIYKIAGPAEQTWMIADPTDLGRIRHDIADVTRRAGMTLRRASSFALSVGEAVNNVLRHACTGTASLHRTADGFIVVVSDRGTGIKAPSLDDIALLEHSPTAGSARMGYKVMISFSDKVYLATGPKGTVVAIEMKLQPQANP